MSLGFYTKHPIQLVRWTEKGLVRIDTDPLLFFFPPFNGKDWIRSRLHPLYRCRRAECNHDWPVLARRRPSASFLSPPHSLSCSILRERERKKAQQSFIVLFTRDRWLQQWSARTDDLQTSRIRIAHKRSRRSGGGRTKSKAFLPHVTPPLCTEYSAVGTSILSAAFPAFLSRLNFCRQNYSSSQVKTNWANSSHETLHSPRFTRANAGEEEIANRGGQGARTTGLVPPFLKGNCKEQKVFL